MTKLLKRATSLVLGLLLLGNLNLSAQRKMENLGRGTYAIRTSTSQVYVSWRITGTEYAQNALYNLYRGTTKIASNLAVSNYVDNTSTTETYQVAAVINGIEQTLSSAVSVNSNIYMTIPLQPLDYTHVQHVFVGDLDGDGEFDFVLDREPDTTGITSKVEAYKRDGTFLWRVDMGQLSLNRNGIEGGAAALSNGMNDGFTVYDMDCDGKAEVLLKTAKGTTFPNGSVVAHTDTIGNFLSVLDGMTGNEKARIQLPTDYASDGVLQTQFNIGYLDGVMPSVIISAKNRIGDGDFNKMLVTYDYRNGVLSQRWKWLRGDLLGSGEHEFHQQRIADLDGDGKDEISEGGYAVDDNGTLMYVIKGTAHGDRYHIGDLDPTRPGLEGYGIQQNNASGLAWFYYDAKTGEIIHAQYESSVNDYARGDVGDYDPRYLGCEMYTFTDGIYNVSGNKTSSTAPWPNFSIWWDGDLLRELLNENIMDKWNYSTSTTSRVLTTYKYNGATLNSRNTQPMYGDILGDWREEMIYEKYDHSCINIYMTTAPTTERIYTLAHNPEYRLCLTTRGYYQSTQADIYIGAGMPEPPVPGMQTAKCVWKGNAANNVWDSGTTQNWNVNSASGSFTNGEDVMFDISGSPDTLVQLSGTLSPSSIKVISALNYTFAGSGSLTGTTGILKAGYGALSLNADCSFTDSVFVQQGSVFVNNALSQSTVKVSWGATIGGDGSIAKPVILSSLSTFSPGRKNEAGTLTFGSGLTIASNSQYLLDITDDVTGVSKPSDKIVVNGNLIISDSLTIVINKFNGTVNPGTYPIFNYSGAFSGNLSKVAITGLFGQKCTFVCATGTISIKVESSRAASTIKWNGTASTWDLLTTPAWNKGLELETFVANDSVILDSIGRINPIITVTGTLPVADIAVETSKNSYSLSGSGILGGTANLTKSGSGCLSLLLSSNTFTGKTTINSGKFEINAIADAGFASSIGAPTSTDGSYFVLNNAYLKYSGTTDMFSNRGMTISGTADTLDVVTSGKMFIWTGLISGSGKLVKTGAGTLRLNTTANTFTGGTLIKGGLIVLADATTSTSGLGSGAVTFDGGTLTLQGTTYGFNNNFVVPEGSTGTLNTDSRNYFYGTLSGGGTLNIYLGGTIDRDIFFGNWSAFTGTLNLTGNTFRIGNGYSYANASFNLGANVTLYHGGTGTSGGNSTAETVTIGDLSGVTGSYLNTENWIIGAKNLNSKFAGVIKGNSVTKNGTGCLELSGANIYTGATTINAGALNITGSLATSTVTVNSGATLTGTGSIIGAVTVASGATITPASGTIGVLSLKNSLSLQSGSNTKIEINKASGAFDQIAVSGTLSLGGTLTISNTSTSAFVPGNSYKIFNVNGTISGSFTSIVPSTPGDNMVWDVSALTTTGTILVKGVQTINFILPTDKKYGDAPFALTATGGASGNPITYSISSGNAVSLSSGTITILQPGTVSIVAKQAGNSNYLLASVVKELIISKGDDKITFTSSNTLTYGESNFVLKVSTASGAAVNFSIISGNAASISGSSLTILKSGEVQVMASRVDDSYYNAASAVQTIVIEKAPQQIQFEPFSNKTYGDAPFQLSATGGLSGNAVTYSVISGDAVSVSGQTVTILKAGSVVIRASQIGSDNYLAASNVDQNLTVSFASQTISFAKPADRVYANESFNLSVSGGQSSNPVVLSLISGDAVSLSGQTITVLKAGTVVIRATQAGNEGYLAAESVDQSFTIYAASQTISFTKPDDHTYGDASFELTVTGGVSGEPVTLTVISGDAVSLSGKTVTIHKAGTVVVRASQMGNEGYSAAEDVEQTLTILKASQTISFAPLEDKVYGDNPFDLSVNTSTTGQEAVFSIVSGDAATITGSTLTIVKAGTVEIEAYQSGNDNYLSSNIVAQSLTIHKASQVLSVDVPSSLTYGDSDFVPAVRYGKSGNPVVVESLSPSVLKVNGSNVSVVGAGNGTIRFSQLGTDNYFDDAASIEKTIVISKAKLSISVADTTKTEGKANPIFRLMYSGFVNADNEQSLTTLPDISCLANSKSVAGTYPITLSGGDDYRYAYELKNGTLTIVPATSVYGISSAKICLYPNPVQDLLNVKSDKTIGKLIVEIESVNGAKLLSKEVRNTAQAEMDMQALQAGVYLIKLLVDEKPYIYKVVKK